MTGARNGADPPGFRTVRLIQLIVAGVLIAGVIAYGEARNRGFLPQRWTELFAVVWLFLIFVLMAVYTGTGTRHAFGRTPIAHFILEPGEELIFSSNFIGGEFYPDLSAIPRGAGFSEWLEQTKFSYRTIMKVWVTNRRLLFGNALRGARRVIPLSDIQSIDAVLVAKWPPFRHSTLIRFRNADKSEALRIGGGRRSRRLIASIERALREG